MGDTSWRTRARITLPFLFSAILLWTGLWGRVAPSPALAQGASAATTARGYVLGPAEGDVLDVPNGRILIKVDPARGSARLAMGVQILTPGKGIAVHLHEEEDEILYLEEGARTVIVGNDQRVAPKGTTIYIPHGVWHGVVQAADQAQVVWVVSPPGLEEFFRAVGTAPGTRAKEFTPEQLADIRRKHGMRSP